MADGVGAGESTSEECGATGDDNTRDRRICTHDGRTGDEGTGTEEPDLEADPGGARGGGNGPEPTDPDAVTETGGHGRWENAEFTDPDSGVWPPALADREQWMTRAGKTGKQPFAPWGSQDHPEADPGDDARWKWGLVENHADKATADDWVRKDPRCKGWAFIQHDDDPLAFVDGDDVRDPDTGEVHPEFTRILDALGVTYADVSTSGAGVHAYYQGELPEGVKQAVFEIDDDPWGANDDAPAVEIYDGKHVCVATGEHIPETPTEVRGWDADALESILDDHDQLPEEPAPSTDRDDYDLEDYDPGATTSDDTTDEIRDCFAALDRLDARRVADRTIVHRWNDTASTSGENRAFAPTWGTNANGTANIVDREIWQDTGGGGYGGPVVMALIDLGEMRPASASPRKATGRDWFRGYEHLRDLGFSLPEYAGSEDDTDGENYRPDPREVDVVIDPGRAWDAAGRVTPDDLDDPLALDTTDDGAAWLCPVTGDRVDDVARATAIAEETIDDAEDPLAEEYAAAYARARERYGAPLPVYRTHADTVQRFDYALAAVRELTFWNLDRDALTAEVTGEGGEVSGDAALTLDPTPVDGWRDSESGESVLVFESGAVWDADAGDDGQVIDPLRFVALDAGLIHSPDTTLEGEEFVHTYGIARDVYGAPLPRWDAGDPDVTPILPPAEALAEDPDPTEGIDTIRDDVERLYRDLATDADRPQVLQALPALGKTTAAIKTAADRPTTYLAARKELMAQAAHKADEHGVSWAHLPIFSDARVDPGTLSDAVAHVREHGKGRLRDLWAILDAVDGEVWADEDDEDTDDVTLDRPTCDTAEGHHSDAWALAVHVARELDYTPRDVHECAEGLFGTDLPCQESGDCPYTSGWDDVADPDDPVDLLIGHYTHVLVESARTHYSRGRNDRTERAPRTLVLDEFPGTTYAERFGEEMRDHAVWLGSALSEDVDDWQDLAERDLWGDEFVRNWLAGDAAAEGNRTHAVATTLHAREQGLAAADTAAEILDGYGDLLDDHDLHDPLTDVCAFDDLSPERRRALAGEIATTIDAIPPEAGGRAVFDWIAEDVVGPLRTAARDLSVDLDVLPAGELRRLVTQAVDAARDRQDGARGRLQGARAALAGGDDGARQLAVWADDGFAHRKAHLLLEAAIRPVDGDAARITTDGFAYHDADDGTTLKHVEVGDGAVALFDRNHHGAELLTPPSRTAGGGDPCPLVGLDATARRSLWATALGDDVRIRDVHDTPQERAECLRNIHDLQVVRTSDLVNSYSGGPEGHNLDTDVALLEHISDEFAGVHAARDRTGNDTVLDDPAVITTKKIRAVLEDDSRAEDATSTWEHYGNLKGSNDLAGHGLAAILGCQHYGDDALERFAALAGEEVDRSGHGHRLDYGGEVANDYLQHMREDQVMQAVLRFARGGSGALVFAHTTALRDDLPVVGQGQVVETWSETATAIARQWQRAPTETFTTSDVADAVDVSRRQVRRVLAEFVDAGYLERDDPGEGRANHHTPTGTPGAGEVALDESGLETPDADPPGHQPLEKTYTANVRVHGVGDTGTRLETGPGSTLPAPAPANGDDPPPEPTG